MATAVQYGFPNQVKALADNALRKALADLAPAWVSRESERFEEVIVAPVNELSRHIMARLTDKVGFGEGLDTVSRHIQDSVEPLASEANSHVGLVLADSMTFARSELNPLIGYDFARLRLLRSDADWCERNSAFLLVSAALLDQDEAKTYLRLRSDEENKMIEELRQWQKELATISANLQASLMQGLDPLAYGNALQSLQSLQAQTKALGKVLALAKKQPGDAGRRADVLLQAGSAQKALGELIKTGAFPPAIADKLQNLMQRLTRTLSSKPGLAQTTLIKAIQTKPMVSQMKPTALPVMTAFQNAASASVIPFPITPQSLSRLAAVPSQAAIPLRIMENNLPLARAISATQPLPVTAPASLSMATSLAVSIAAPNVTPKPYVAQSAEGARFSSASSTGNLNVHSDRASVDASITSNPVSIEQPILPKVNFLQPVVSESPIILPASTLAISPSTQDKPELRQATAAEGPKDLVAPEGNPIVSQPAIRGDNPVQPSAQQSDMVAVPDEARKEPKAPPAFSMHPCDDECCKPKSPQADPVPAPAPTTREMNGFQPVYEVRQQPVKPDDMIIREAKGAGSDSAPEIVVVQEADMNLNKFNKLRPGGRGPAPV